MTTSKSIWMSPQAHDRLQHELATLRELISSEAAQDSDENQVAIQRARQARIQHIHDLLLNAVVGDTPPDDGVAEPGMVLTVRFDETDGRGAEPRLAVSALDHSGLSRAVRGGHSLRASIRTTGDAADQRCSTSLRSCRSPSWAA